MTVRYALYLAPDRASALWRFGSAVIGYDAESGEEPHAPDLAGFDVLTWRARTEAPRRYGFHGTLKAPFRLAEGFGTADLVAAVTALARVHRPFDLPPLEVCALGAFLALMPRAPVPALDDLAAFAVCELDDLRAPLSPEDIARRQPDRLTHHQLELLEAYGYPYVLDEFRFHMTLTGPLADAELERAFNALSAAFAARIADAPLEIRDVAVFIQETPRSRFRLMERIPLGD